MFSENQTFKYRVITRNFGALHLVAMVLYHVAMFSIIFWFLRFNLILVGGIAFAWIFTWPLIRPYFMPVKETNEFLVFENATVHLEDENGVVWKKPLDKIPMLRVWIGLESWSSRFSSLSNAYVICISFELDAENNTISLLNKPEPITDKDESKPKKKIPRLATTLEYIQKLYKILFYSKKGKPDSDD